jgi:hypothetical protein
MTSVFEEGITLDGAIAQAYNLGYKDPDAIVEHVLARHGEEWVHTQLNALSVLRWMARNFTTQRLHAAQRKTDSLGFLSDEERLARAWVPTIGPIKRLGYESIGRWTAEQHDERADYLDRQGNACHAKRDRHRGYSALIRERAATCLNDLPPSDWQEAA